MSGMKKVGKERRKFIRLKAHHLLKYRVAGKGEEELSFVRITVKNVNICAGALFVAKEDIPCDSTVELEINFPQHPHSIKVVSRVVRSRALKKMGGFEVGVEFVNVD